MSDWVKMFGSPDVPYNFPLDLEGGETYAAKPPYPDLKVEHAEILYPRRIMIQQVELVASAAERDREEDIRLTRVVLETEAGEQIELSRNAIPLKDVGDRIIDMSVCDACGGDIPEGQVEVIDDKAYHLRCVQRKKPDEDIRDLFNDRDSTRDTRSSSGGAGSNVTEGTGKEAHGIAPEAAPQTVSKFRGKKGNPTHMVTIAKIGDDKYLTTLWAKEHNGVSGTSVGKWGAGLFPNQLPRDSDVGYIAEKFFLGADLATRSDLRVWNKLYMDAFREIRE